LIEKKEVHIPCEVPVVDFLLRGGDCVDIGRRVREFEVEGKGKIQYGGGRREQKIEPRKRRRA
jgi:hypothetical protein